MTIGAILLSLIMHRIKRTEK